MRNKKSWALSLFTMAGLAMSTIGHSQTVNVNGIKKKWGKVKVSLTLPGSNLVETSSTFKDKRMDVIFTDPTGKNYRVPGFFAADGNAANTSGSEGKVFNAFLRPNVSGNWTYRVLYYAGTDVATKNVNQLPSPVHNLTGSVGNIGNNNLANPDLKAKGRLEYQTTGNYNQRRYLKFAETGEYFLKLGPDSPENYLNYNDFDFNATPNNCGNCGKHFYTDHVSDFNPTSDPTWKNGKGKGIIGAINYLRNQQMNSISMSLFGGDDKNVFPWKNLGDKFVFDVSKLEQWEIVFDHAEKSGLLLHFKLAENENWDALNDSQIKVYYREMVARFGHHLAVEWNISEEYRGTPQSAIARIDWLASIDPWQNSRVIHTYPGEHSKYQGWLDSNAKLTGASIQSSQNNNYKDAYNGNSGILTWINKSKAANTPWIIASDEQNPGSTGIYVSEDMSNANVKEEARTIILWKTLMAGGQGVMWYGGKNGDFKTENFNRFSTLFKWSRYAIVDFFKGNNIEFWKTVNSDNLVSGNATCLAEAGNTYVIYLDNGGSTNLNLSGQSGAFTVKWFDPRNGGTLKNGNVTSINGGASRSIGNPPNSGTSDWVALVTKSGSSTGGGSLAKNIPGKIEAEDFDAQTGIQTEDSSDTGAGMNIGYVNNSDTVNYDVNVATTGAYTVAFRVATATTGGSIKIKSNGTNVGQVAVPTTSGWQNWQTVEANVNLTSGTQNLQLEFVGGSGYLFNLNWVEFILNPNNGGGSNSPCSADFEEINGFVVIEAENIDVAGVSWNKKTVKTGYSGAGYISWDGNDSFGTPGNGLIAATIKINQAGKYRLQWRSRVGEGSSSTDFNDSWLRFNDASDFYGEKGAHKVYPKGTGKTPVPNGQGANGWFKVYLSGSLDWTWVTSTSDNDGHQIFVEFDQPGVYTMEISGRSKNHLIDRIVLSKSGNGTDLSLAETPCSGTTLVDNVDLQNVATTLPRQLSYTTKVNYSATQERDLVVAIWKGSTWLGSKVTRVQAGSGSENVTVTLNTLPAFGNNYSIKTHIRPVGTNGSQAISLDEVNNITISGASLTTKTSLQNNSVISLYPNPVKDILMITGVENTEMITVVDLSGRIVAVEKQDSENGIVIDTSQLEAGVYIALIANGNTKNSYKFIKE